MTSLALWQIVLLALVQGAAELLPVSSSAHVIFAQKLLGLDPGAPEMTFLLVMLHTGTMVAVLAYFRKRWMEVLHRLGASFIRAIVITTAATGVVGLGLKIGVEKLVLERMLGHSKGEIEHLFRSLPLIGFWLATAGVLIWIAGRARGSKGAAASKRLSDGTSLWVGVVQGLCLPFRGFSRSGATISTALLRGVNRDLAEDFSFALAVVLTPAVIVQQAMRLRKAHAEWSLELLTPGMIGMTCAIVSGFLALRFLSKVLESGHWQRFAYYCWGFAGVLWIASALGL